MNGDAFRALRKRLGITQKALADTLGTTVRTLRRWESGHSPVPKSAEIAVGSLGDKMSGRGVKHTQMTASDAKLRELFDKALVLIQQQGGLIEQELGGVAAPEERWAYTLPRLLTDQQDEWLDVLEKVPPPSRKTLLKHARQFATAESARLRSLTLKKSGR
jgi:transcriptional regulator with XRE-family HTH domain